ncbi:hypothetical protein GCM10011506_18330 [Marivirga lumbricoides]|uniref:Uncharacterized protein n=1 Tax=Marivirga lumbricoides TaxID=1046115 RepID=A0ABQ1M3S7_9BACT|nr:hypothetical protein GCM10011506_18330 [Marivirga lumbricoides]
MPANKKHLSPSFHQRFAKITAGFIGGFMIVVTFFLILAHLIDHRVALFTLKFAGFIVWCAFMIIPFLFKNGWKAWAVYLAIILFLSAILYFLIQNSPISISSL